MSAARRPADRRPAATHRPSLQSRPFAPPPSAGQGLDAATGARLGARFGHDFSRVRVHAGAPAAEAADALGASAYTVGSDIVFGEGQFQPGSPATERLLAHELTHVVQRDRWGGGDGALRSGHADPSEREAEEAAGRVLDGQDVDVRAAPRAAISCFDPAHNDVQDDFWNTKSALGNQTGSVVDSAINTFWDGVGLLPGGSAVSTGVDLAKSGYSEGMSTLHGWEADLTGDTGERMRAQQYHEAAGSFLGDAGVDVTGLIPGYGTAESAAAGGYDLHRTIDLARGADPATAPPSSGDLQKRGASAAWNWANPPAPAAAPDPNAAPNPDLPPPNMPADPWQMP